jgi:hypothetical protein
VKRFQLTLDMMASQMIDAKVNNVEVSFSTIYLSFSF